MEFLNDLCNSNLLPWTCSSKMLYNIWTKSQAFHILAMSKFAGLKHILHYAVKTSENRVRSSQKRIYMYSVRQSLNCHRLSTKSPITSTQVTMAFKIVFLTFALLLIFVLAHATSAVENLSNDAAVVENLRDNVAVKRHTSCHPPCPCKCYPLSKKFISLVRRQCKRYRKDCKKSSCRLFSHGKLTRGIWCCCKWSRKRSLPLTLRSPFPW